MLKVIVSPGAETQLGDIYDYIASESSPASAKRFIDAILERCQTLEHMPRRGLPRDDLRPGLRTLSYRKRALIAYAVDEKAVTILGVFYSGQDFETALRDN